MRVVWRGGANSGDFLAVAARRNTSLSHFPELQSAVEQMVVAGHSDQTIAETLTSQGDHSPKGDTVLVSTVRTIRLSKGQLHQLERIVADFQSNSSFSQGHHDA